MTAIAPWTFYGCSSLLSVIIPESVKSIGDCAFYGCSGLRRIITGCEIPSACFDRTLSAPVFCNDPEMLPPFMRPLAAIGFAEKPDGPDTGRGRKHIKYIKANAAELQKEAFAHPSLLTLMFSNRLLDPETAESFLAAAQAEGNTEIIAVILQYQHLYIPGSVEDAMSRFEL
jgi:hypothetical protein